MQFCSIKSKNSFFVPTSNSYRTSKTAKCASSLVIVGFYYLLGEDQGLSFWLDNISGAATAQFMVSWNGTNLFNQCNLGAFAFTNFQFQVVGASNGSVLQFGFLNAANFFGLDDVTL